MNDGKICVSVCASTADETIENIKQAANVADIVEVRFDCLEKGDIAGAVEKMSAAGIAVPLIATFRATEQGGRQSITLTDRSAFWAGDSSPFWGGDFEEDAFGFSAHWQNKIASYHDFDGVPENLTDIYERLAARDPDVIKIAVATDQITEAIPIWHLLARAKAENKQMIPVAMGEAGKWTRILSLAHGAFLTFAALNSRSETAPGQISAKEMKELYRVEELNTKTAVYGVIGGDTSYSISPMLQNTGFKAAEMNAVFVPLQVGDLDEFMRRMVMPATREVELNFHGFAVTNPHKKAIINYLDHIDETAEKIGAVNTVKVEEGKLFGYNTDAEGFVQPLKKQFGDLAGARIAIVGAGGAARACIYALLAEQAEVTVFARDEEKASKIAEKFGVNWARISNFRSEISNSEDHVSKVETQRSGLHDGNSEKVFSGFDIIVNSTPLGTKGEAENETVAVAEQLEGVRLVYDLVYNPAETRLLREAKSAGVEAIGGIEMLIAQGAKQFEIWTGQTASIEMLREAVSSRFK